MAGHADYTPVTGKYIRSSASEINTAPNVLSAITGDPSQSRCSISPQLQYNPESGPQTAIAMNRLTKTLRLPASLALVFLIAACASAPVLQQAQETADIEIFFNDVMEVSEQAGAGRILVVFDLDNTLLAMEQGLGSDQWYEWQKDAADQNPCDPRVVADRLAVQGALYFASAMRPTQEDAPRVLRKIQQAGIPAIALTSRGVDYRLQTFRELRRNGYEFRWTAPGPAGGWDENFIPDNGIRPARYEDGVFLTAGQHKGAMLQALIARIAMPMPAAILVLDDKQTNLDAVLETFSGLQVPVHAWRYTAEDPNVEGFDGDESAAIWNLLAPALQTIQDVLGPDNYSLPPTTLQAGCEASPD